MNYTIKNDVLTVEIASKGAELMSIKKDGVEYVWQGDPAYWSGRAYNLFPACGRMYEGKYICRGKTYEMKIHGIVRYMECDVSEHEADRIVFTLESNEETKKIYPFDFKYFAEFKLEGNKLITKYTAVNTGDTILPCTFGGHPGFNVPLDKGEFEDYYLEFSEECAPEEAFFSHSGKVEGLLRDKKFIDLKHSLFDNDSFFMTGCADTVTLKSDKSEREVTVVYPELKYLGVWHMPKMDAPYVCIEPWCGSPAPIGQYSDIDTMADMFHLEPNEIKSVSFDIIIK